MSPSALQLETNVPQDEPDHCPEAVPSSLSRVPANFFDPVGVGELKRTMTTRSTRPQRGSSPLPHLHSFKKVDTRSFSSLNYKGPGADDSFDFEHILKDLIRR